MLISAPFLAKYTLYCFKYVKMRNHPIRIHSKCNRNNDKYYISYGVDAICHENVYPIFNNGPKQFS